MKVIGFIGAEKYDVILYLAELLNKLGSKVLLIDNAADKSLSACMPFDDPNDTDFRGSRVLVDLGDLAAVPEEFDYALVDLGFADGSYDLDQFDELYFVTDLQKQNVNRIARLVVPDTTPRYFIIRNYNTYRRYLKVALKLLRGLYAVEDNTFIIEMDGMAEMRMLDCQYRNTISLRNVPLEMRETLGTMIADDFDEKAIQAAIKRMMR